MLPNVGAGFAFTILSRFQTNCPSLLTNYYLQFTHPVAFLYVDSSNHMTHILTADAAVLLSNKVMSTTMFKSF